jgi:dynein heavy chain 2
VDNDFDLRVLRTYMEQIFKDSVMKGQESLSGIMQAPQGNKSNDFFAAISKMPDTDIPELFGLPSNIDRSV